MGDSEQTTRVKMLLKLIFAGAITFAMGSSLQGQKVYEDVILLQTAEVVRGKITENVPPDDVVILLDDSTVRVIP